jgi:hypothetical protein
MKWIAAVVVAVAMVLPPVASASQTTPTGSLTSVCILGFTADACPVGRGVVHRF